VPPAVAAAGASQQRPEADIAFGQPCAFRRWPDVPTTVLAGRDDRFFPLDFQRRVARRSRDRPPTWWASDPPESPEPTTPADKSAGRPGHRHAGPALELPVCGQLPGGRARRALAGAIDLPERRHVVARGRRSRSARPLGAAAALRAEMRANAGSVRSGRSGQPTLMRGEPFAPVELTFPAVPATARHARRTARAAARRADADAKAVELAVSEAVTNVILHAYRAGDGQDDAVVRLALSVEGDHLRVVVEDDGDGFSPRADSPGAGVGLALIAELADGLQVEAPARGTRLVMRFRVGQTRPA
jgi:anti-sigma regulatory factor (Ser/Thr protein kinase)